jgi:ATP-binding cassette subfamily B (MDR/TAP) protein 1
MAGTNSKWFAIVGAGSFVCSWIMFITWMVSGERQTIEFRRRYF